MEESSGESPSADVFQVRCLECGAESALAAELCTRCGAPLSHQPPGGGSGSSVPPFPADTLGGPAGQWTSSGYSRRPALVVAGAGAVLLIALIAVITVIATRASSQSADQLTWDQLRPGDCLAGSNMGLGNSDPWPDYVTSVACTKPHEAEIVFAGGIWPKSLAYPGSSTVSDQANARCDAAFSAYDGVDISTSAFWVQSIAPDSPGWASGDRSVACVAYLPSASGPSGGTPTSYSIKGSHK